MDQKALYQNYQARAYAPGNQQHAVNMTGLLANAVKLPAFMCPSDSIPNNGDSPNNYVFCEGTNIGYGGGITRTDQNGMFNMEVPVKVSDIFDGTSNTIAMSENVAAGNTSGTVDYSRIKQSVPVPGGFALSFPTKASIDTWSASCNSSTNFGGNNGNYNGRWWHRGLHSMTLFNTLLAPNALVYNCSANCTGCDPDGPSMIPPRSRHSGGVHVLMGDGATRFVNNNIDYNTWWAIGSRNDKRVPGNF